MKDWQKLVLLGVVAVVLVGLYLGLGLNSRIWQYALSRRIPRVVAIIGTGSAIAISTTMFQTITNNRILTPSVMGFDSLYLLIQTLVVFLFGSNSLVITNANINFLLSVVLMVGFSFVIYNLIFHREEGNIFFLLLVGMLVGTLFQSITSFIQMVIDPNEFMIVQNKMFASFNNINLDVFPLALAIFAVATLWSVRYFSVLDVLALGRDSAVNLGVKYDKVVWRLLVLIVVLVSVSTALVGPITFLGLLVVNLAWHFLRSYQHKTRILGAVLISVIALVGGQLVVERLLNFATPLSVLINLAGGLYFIYLVIKESSL